MMSPAATRATCSFDDRQVAVAVMSVLLFETIDVAVTWAVRVRSSDSVL